MRFAWLRKNAANNVPAQQNAINRFIFVAYNAVYWLPIVLPVIGVLDYKTGFLTFAIILLLRLAANLYRNNSLTLEQAETFPFRSP